MNSDDRTFSSNPHGEQTQPPKYAPPPPPTPPRRPLVGRPLFWVLVVVAVFLVASAMNLVQDFNKTTASTATPTVQPTTVVHPTTVPTATPAVPTATTQPTAVNTYAPLLLGSDISTFIAHYGKPTSQQGGYYVFKPASGEVDVLTEQGNLGAPYTNRVISILDNAPGTTTWDKKTALANCLLLAPVDAVYERTITLSNGLGIEQVYGSDSLASQLPAKEFVDENLNPDKPGTFGVILSYDLGSTTQFLSCADQISLQSV